MQRRKIIWFLLAIVVCLLADNLYATYATDDKISLLSTNVQDGLNKGEDGTWYYYKNNTIDTSFTGLAKNSYGWWYVKDGKLDRTYTGLAKNSYGWWYVKSGKVDMTYTGMAKNENGWFYVKNGKVDLSYTGLAENEHGTWYMVDGKVASDISGLTKISKVWMYLVKGKVDKSYVGLAKNESGWWYVENGQVEFKYTGMAKNQYGWWYVKSGKLDRTYTGLATNEYGTWYMVDGKVASDTSGLTKVSKIWMYLSKGKVDTSYKGLAKNESGWWYVKDGQVDFTYTGLAKNENGWWHVTNGKLDSTYTGISTNEYGKWYVKNGKLDRTYSGEYIQDGITYTIKAGEVVGQNVAVTGVEITNDKSFVVDINGTASKTMQCTYNVLPSTATNKNVTWKSSDTSVATVDSKGKITAVGYGNATITVTTADGGKQDTYMVYVYESSSAIRGGGNWWLKMKLAKTSLYMTSANANTTNGTKVQLGKDAGTDVQLWQFVDCMSSNGGVAFKPRANTDTYVLTANTSSGQLNIGSLINLQKLGANYSSSIFDIIKLWDDSYILKLKDKNLAVGVTSATEGTQLSFVEFNVWDHNQRWFIEAEQKIAPTQITLSTTSMSLNVNGTATLTATITPTNATDKSVVWSSSNTSVATVNANGIVTAVGNGTATITVKTVDGNKIATCKVTVTTKVTGVDITNSKSFVVDINDTANKTMQCTYNVLPSTASNKNVTWKSSDTSVATVDSNGKITAVGVGYATITVTTADGGKQDTHMVYVYESNSAIRGGGNWWLKMKLAKTSLYMTSANANTTNGTKVQLGQDVGADTQLWQFIDCISSNGGVAFKPRANTDTYVLTANTSSAALNIGSVVNLQRLGTDYNSSIFTIIRLWDDSYILKLKGMDLAVGVSSATEGTQLTFVEYNVWDHNQRWFIEGVEKVVPTNITLSKTSLSLNPKGTYTLTATVTPANAENKSVVWSSSNTSVVTVDQNGVVTAVGDGTATITVKTVEGNKTATCTVNVVATNDYHLKLESVKKETGFRPDEYWNENYNKYTSHCTWSATQCHGWALTVGWKISGKCPVHEWKQVYNLDGVKTGDIIRYSGHTIVVTSVEGDRIYYADCNGNGGYLKVAWNQSIGKGEKIFGSYVFEYRLVAP